jgi:hypothetical protein
MKIDLKKYCVLVFVLLMLSACANRRYIFIGIEKPEELKLASTRAPYFSVVEKDSLPTLALKENQKLIYYNSTDDYTANHPDSLPKKVDSIPTVPVKKITKPSVKTKKSSSKISDKTAADKLNAALKISNKK